MRTLTNRRRFCLLLLLAVLTALVYSNTMEAPFFLDDKVNIVENPFVRLTELTPEKFVRLAFESPCPNRPVANVSFGLNYFFDQYNPVGYHAVNILVHITSGILLYYFVIITLMVNPGLLRHGHLHAVAFFTALIWLVHPLQTQSVTYIVQRMNSMSAMFYLASLLSYIKGRLATEDRKKWLWFIVCLVGWILALGSKEIAASLPFVLLLYEWYVFQHCGTLWLRRNSWFLVSVISVFGLAVLLYTDFAPFRWILSGYSCRDFTLLERVLTQFRVIVYYVGLIIYPHPSRLSLLHDFGISRSLIDPPSTLICIAAIVVTVLAACWLSRKEPLLSFAVLWFFGNLVIESSVVGLEIIFEHRIYLPSMLVSLLIVTLCYRYVRNTTMATSLLCICVAVLSFWTYQRNTLWNDKIAFWQDCTNKACSDVRAFHNLGNAYLKRDRLDDAAKSYKKALTIDSDYVKSLVGLGHVLREKGDITEAISVHERAIKMAPKNGSSYNHLGADYIKLGQIDSAFVALKKAVALTPYDYRAFSNLGLAYARTGNVLKAISMYEQAITIRPDFAPAYNNSGNLFLNPKQSERAIGFFRKALRLNPEYADAHSNLGLALIYQGKFEQGIDEIEVALRLEPDHQDATFNLARVYEQTGMYESAVKQYQKSIHLNPNDVEAYFNAGFICLHHLAGNEQAIALFKAGLSIDPDHQKAQAVTKIIRKLKNKSE